MQRIFCVCVCARITRERERERERERARRQRSILRGSRQVTKSWFKYQLS